MRLPCPPLKRSIRFRGAATGQPLLRTLLLRLFDPFAARLLSERRTRPLLRRLHRQHAGQFILLLILTGELFVTATLKNYIPYRQPERCAESRPGQP